MIKNPNPAVPPAVVPPSPNEWPNQVKNVTGITRSPQPIITSTAHGFTSQDIGLTSVMFIQVGGMIQINGRPGVIQAIPDANHFTVNIDTSQFFSYTSGGYAIVDTGIPPVETVGSQIFNTPFQNIA